MANRYWVGGTADWDGTAGSKWALTSGASGGEAVPTSADDVFFDGASGTVTVTVKSGGGTCKNLNCTGFTGTLAGSDAIVSYGSVTLVSGMTLSHSGALQLYAAGSANLTSAGKTIGSVGVYGTSSDYTLQDDLTVSASVTLSRGSLNTNGKAINAASFLATSTSTKTLTLGSTTFTISGSVTTTPWNMNMTGTTLSATSSTIVMSTVNVPNTFAGGGGTYGTLTIGGGASTTSITITGANTFGELKHTRTAAFSVIFPAGATTTVTTWGLNGTAGKLVTLASSSAGTQWTLEKSGGTAAASYISVSDCIGSPAGAWKASHSTDGGNNTNWSFSAVGNSLSWANF